MKKIRLLKNYLLAPVWLVVLGFLWITLAPSQLGGRFIYVIVTGNSMEPYFHSGDLAIMQKTADYQVGDVVVYHHPILGPVIHRIIAVEGDRFVIKGDHNPWTDSYKPSVSDMAGKLCLYLPHAGSIALGFRRPFGAAFFAGIIGFMIFWPFSGPEEQLEGTSDAIKA